MKPKDIGTNEIVNPTERDYQKYGAIVMGQARHHFFWEKKDYRTKLEKKFRTHEGLVTPLMDHNDPNHLYLHHKLDPPLKPERYMMAECIDLLQETPREGLYWGVHALIEYFDGADPEISEHLCMQLGYLAMDLSFLKDSPIVDRWQK